MNQPACPPVPPAPHVFVLRGDLRRLACDHRLVPGDGRGHVKGTWWRAPAPPGDAEDAQGRQLEHDDPEVAPAFLAAGLWSNRGHGVDAAGQRIAAPSERPTIDRVLEIKGEFAHIPRPWVVNVSGRGKPLGWYVEGALAFVAAAAKRALEPGGRRMLGRRHRPLLALPVVGTGDGGQAHATGAVLDALLPALQAAALEHGVDVALVAFSDTVFAAAQAVRVRRGFDPVALLGVENAEVAEGLARRAAQGELAVFLGAGVSMAAGLPDWGGLLARLEARLALPPDLVARLARLSHLDRAQFLALRFGDGLGDALAHVLGGHRHHAIAHALVAGLPVREAVTTNYDTLYEGACRGARAPVAALPYEPVGHRARWLVKLHGCLADGRDDIVLSRESYLRYTGRRVALGGIVQALLITRHLLFLGFSLTDDNFLRIIDEVRRAIEPRKHASQPAPSVPGPSDAHAEPPTPPPPPVGHDLGTALMLTDDPVLRALWQPDIDWCAMANDGAAPGDAAGNLEVFLDVLSLRATAPRHLLDPRLRDVSTPADAALREALQPLLSAGDAARQSAAWPLVADLLERLGFGALAPSED